MITDEDKERVRAATDIVSLVGETVVLRQRGNDFWGCCPFHQEKSPSFHVIPATGQWHCFGCNTGGDVFSYVMHRDALDFPDAIRYLADRAGIELTEERVANRGPKRNRLIEVLEATQAFYATMLMRGKQEGAGTARRYLAGRGFSSTVCASWGLGFAPGSGQLVTHLRGLGFTPQEMEAADVAVMRGTSPRDRFFDRAMFPIRDERGRCIAFGGRVLGDGKPKYLNTRETTLFHKSKQLFAFDRAKDSIVSCGRVIVVEGYTDVIALHEAGFTNVVATLGTALTEDHVKMLTRFTKVIVCMFDGDAAGQHAAEAALQYMDRTTADLRCVILPDNLDPAEFLAARGPEALTPLLDSSAKLVDYVFTRLLDNADISVPGLRMQAVDHMVPLLVPLWGSASFEKYLQLVFDRLQVPRNVVEERVEKAARGAKRSSRVEQAKPAVVEPPLDPFVGIRNKDERRQVDFERELLSLMATQPETVQPQADRIASFTWADERNKAIAWAMLACPQGSTPSQCVAAARLACDDADRIIASGKVSSVADMPSDKKMAFVLDSLEISTSATKIKQLRARLASAALSGDEANALSAKVDQLTTRQAELLSKVTNMENYGNSSSKNG